MMSAVWPFSLLVEPLKANVPPPGLTHTPTVKAMVSSPKVKEAVRPLGEGSLSSADSLGAMVSGDDCSPLPQATRSEASAAVTRR